MERRLRRERAGAAVVCALLSRRSSRSARCVDPASPSHSTERVALQSPLGRPRECAGPARRAGGEKRGPALIGATLRKQNARTRPLSPPVSYLHQAHAAVASDAQPLVVAKPERRGEEKSAREKKAERARLRENAGRPFPQPATPSLSLHPLPRDVHAGCRARRHDVGPFRDGDGRAVDGDLNHLWRRRGVGRGRSRGGGRQPARPGAAARPARGGAEQQGGWQHLREEEERERTAALRAGRSSRGEMRE